MFKKVAFTMFPVDDTDQALAAVTRALRVNIVRFTRYYVRIVARH